VRGRADRLVGDVRSLIGAGDAAQDKPNPAPVALALEPSGVEPGEGVWLVGDTGTDMECAYNSGCIPVCLAMERPRRSSFVASRALSSPMVRPCFTLCGACDSPARAHLDCSNSGASSECLGVNWPARFQEGSGGRPMTPEKSQNVQDVFLEPRPEK